MQNEEIRGFAQNEEINNPNQQNYNEPLVRDLREIQTPAPAAFPTPDNPPWGSDLALGVWFLSVLAIVFVPAILSIPYIMLNREIPIESLPRDPMFIFINLLGIVPAHLLTLGIVWLVATRNFKYSLRDTLGLDSGGFQWWYYPVILSLIFGLFLLLGLFIPDGDNEMEKMVRSSRMAVYAVAIMATFTAPIVEEVVYRGILYSAFQRTIGVLWSIVAVTIIFAGIHFWQYWGNPRTIVVICLLSLSLTLVRVKTKSLLPCIILHTLINGIQAVLLIAEPYLPKTEQTVQEGAAAIIRIFN